MHFIVFLDLISLAPSAIQKCLCQSLWVCFPSWNTLHEKQKQLALASSSPVPVCFKEHADVFLVVLYSNQFILPFSLTCSHKMWPQFLSLQPWKEGAKICPSLLS
uniref:Secreted protein n=2 Tax=Micrurus TaxID=8634 RepID=A0A2D4GL86_MICCO